MIAGTPGRTYRHALSEEVEDAQNIELPASIRRRTTLLGILHARGANDRAIALKNANRIASIENILKKHQGVLESFRRGNVLAAKRADEAAIRKALASDPKLAAEYDAAVTEERRLLAEKHKTLERDAMFAWLYTSSQMLTQANVLYRNSIERAKPDFDRADEYTERDRNRLAGTVVKNRRSIEPGSDRAGLRPFLIAAQGIAPLDKLLAATAKPTREAQADALLDQVYGSTNIGDPAAEQAMFNETNAQLMARNDSMIAFAAALRTLGDEIDKRDAAYAGALSRLRPTILRALRVARAGRVYPDANSTLRVGFGVVKGYAPRDAVVYAPQTVIEGVVQKTTGERPFDSPPRLLEKAAARDFGSYVDPDLGTLPVDFASTNIVTNGSSGSATLNAYGELCGLAFDSNWEGVGSDYLVDERVTRTVHVDSRYMLWVMEKVDGATNLIEELTISR
ncbi:MAG TPA: S46 family peptidase, partial [Thermoanaerobaculia bacterium]|nr:S46 family peptidase [Thermoanaerobaculia bacterium]